jgi:transposase
MGKQYYVTLTQSEREQLHKLVSTGTGPAQQQRNARILLKADQSVSGPGWQDEHISAALEVSIATIGRVRRRFYEQGLAAALQRRQQTRPGPERQCDGEQEAHLVALACSGPPRGFARWSLRLLADKMVELAYIEQISYETVRRVLKKTNFNPGVKRCG